MISPVANSGGENRNFPRARHFRRAYNARSEYCRRYRRKRRIGMILRLEGVLFLWQNSLLRRIFSLFRLRRRFPTNALNWRAVRPQEARRRRPVSRNSLFLSLLPANPAAHVSGLAGPPYPIASSSPIIRSITERPMLQNAGSRASRPKGFRSSA